MPKAPSSSPSSSLRIGIEIVNPRAVAAMEIAATDAAKKQNRDISVEKRRSPTDRPGTTGCAKSLCRLKQSISTSVPNDSLVLHPRLYRVIARR